MLQLSVIGVGYAFLGRARILSSLVLLLLGGHAENLVVVLDILDHLRGLHEFTLSPVCGKAVRSFYNVVFYHTALTFLKAFSAATRSLWIDWGRWASFSFDMHFV